MLRIADYNQSFKHDQDLERQKVIIYGAGQALIEEISNIPEIDCICDKHKKTFQGIEVIKPADLEFIQEPVRVLFVIRNKNREIFSEVCSELEKLRINATIYNYFDNVSFDYFDRKYKAYVVDDSNKDLVINLVCRDNWWILSKFAEQLYENLKLMNVDVRISDHVDPEADINHHIQFGMSMPLPQDTLMVSHVDCGYWLDALKSQMQTAKLAICMSKETMLKLACMGIPRQKLCYITPAQDGLIKPKKYVVGVTHRNHNDFRKRADALTEIFEKLDPNYFLIKIMGDGWESVVSKLMELGFEVEYHNGFDICEYRSLIPSLDYYMFFGMDEGSMGFLDAVAAGVETIVTPQGFHLDIKDGITYPCITIDDFFSTLLKLQEKRKRVVRTVTSLTWADYAKKHLEIWEYLLRKKKFEELYQNHHIYEDGIFSMFLENLGYSLV
ncbi:MAG: hypothetical protein HFJ06_01150 [Lachnospiraceae bacterium]|nr:hypothetical protein [Lachnospiraceae bacterium]MCI9658120.1 hypothetical protein [Lachnospiraceae bacterium]